MYGHLLTTLAASFSHSPSGTVLALRPLLEAVRASCNCPTCSHACSCCTHKRSLALDAAQTNLHLMACLADADSAPMMQELGQVDGVCSFWEAAQSLVASLAERMGLLAHTPDAVEAAREKQVRADAPLLAYNSLAASVWLCTSTVWTLGEQERSSFSLQCDAHGNTLAQDFDIFNNA